MPPPEKKDYGFLWERHPAVKVDSPDDVLIIGHPKVNQTIESSLKGGGSPSAIPEVGPRMTSRHLIQFNNFLPTEGPDAAVTGKLELGKPIAFLSANHRGLELRRADVSAA